MATEQLTRGQKYYRANRERLLESKRLWAKNQGETLLARRRELYASHRWKAMQESRDLDKLAVINVYTNGEGTCRHCGQGDIDVLCLDHINDDGAAHRKEIGREAFRWAIRNDYPPIFQVLCYNCNIKKERVRRRTA